MANVADGWIPMKQDPLAEGVQALRRAFEAAGRDPDDLAVRAMVDFQFTSDGVPDLEATLETIPALLDAGATHIEILPLYFVQEPAAFPEFCEKALAARQRYGR